MLTSLSLIAVTSLLAAPPAEYVDGELLVTFRAGTDAPTRTSTLQQGGHQELGRLLFNKRQGAAVNRTLKISVPAGTSLDEAMARLREDPSVEAVQPNYLHHIFAPADAEYFSLQWALANSGDNTPFDGIPGIQGPDPRVAGADINALEAYDAISDAGLTPAPVLAAVIDTGIDYLHPDLAPIIWTNPGEIAGNDIDDDDNGYVDDVHGYDFDGGHPDPMDGHGHGTHCSGVIGALQATAEGMCGIASNVQLMALKGLSDGGSGSSFGLSQALLYAADNGALVSNNSWGGGGFDPMIFDAVQTARDAGHLVVAAAGNAAMNTDFNKFGPAGFELDNVVSVLATTAWKDRASFSNYGAHGADLGAPGHEILSTVPGLDPGFGYPVPGPGWPAEQYQISFDPGYGFAVPWSGTSMAAPQVTGASVVVLGLADELIADWTTLSPVEQMQAVRARLLARTEPWPSLHGLTVTGGHLDLAALVSQDATPPDALGELALERRGTSWVTLSATATGDDGTTGQATAYDVRVARGESIDVEHAARLPFVWAPAPAGDPDRMHIDGLFPGQTYTIAIAVLDEAGNASGYSEPITFTTSQGIRLFGDDVERGSNGWSASGGWAISNEGAASGSRAWNDSPGANYGNGVNATLRSRHIGGIANRPLVLRWMQRLDVDNQDVGFVTVQPFAGITAGEPRQVAIESNRSSGFEERVVRLGVLPGDSLELSFTLSTDEADAADGWLIDDVEVVAESIPGETLLDEDFADDGAWDLAPPWSVADGRLVTSGTSLPNNLRASATLADPFDLSAMRGAIARIDVVSGALEPGDDVLHWEYSLDGVSWRSLATFTGTLPAATHAADLGPALGRSGVLLRVRLDTGVYGNSGPVSLDNLRVVGVRATDNAPVLTINAPANTSEVAVVDGSAPSLVRLNATAADAEDGSLGAYVVWSEAGGELGTGATLMVPLALGAHSISAEVVDLDGNTDSASVSFTLVDNCPSDATKGSPGVCGCGTADADSDDDGLEDCLEACDDDPLKLEEGACGCGVPDTDSDGDDLEDCLDGCPDDGAKAAPGDCGCGALDIDDDGDGVAACLDECEGDADKSEPGVCGCGEPDDDLDGDLTLDCEDGCPADEDKTEAGRCGCGVADDDSDDDGVLDCHEDCDSDDDKTAPGACGCGTPDTDADRDGTAACLDACDSDSAKIAPGVCGCGVADNDSDADGSADCDDECPADARKSVPGECGCGLADHDSDDDGTADCHDACPSDGAKTAAGTCGCGRADEDANANGVMDCVDEDTDPDAGPDPVVPPTGCSCAGGDAVVGDGLLAFGAVGLALGARRRRRARDAAARA